MLNQTLARFASFTPRSKLEFHGVLTTPRLTSAPSVAMAVAIA